MTSIRKQPITGEIPGEQGAEKSKTAIVEYVARRDVIASVEADKTLHVLGSNPDGSRRYIVGRQCANRVVKALADAGYKIVKDSESPRYALAQLRHAYMQLNAGSVVDQKEFARGLIAPQIRRLEKFIEQT